MESFLQNGSVRIHFQTWGTSGPWITLVNGHTRSLRDFNFVAKNFASRGLRVLSFDNRGAGQSTCELDFTISDMVSDILALWDNLSIPKSHLAGISMGGQICQLLATSAPERVETLILISTASRATWIAHSSNDEWIPDQTAIEGRLSRHFSASYLSKNRLILRAMAKSMLGNVDGTFNMNARAQRQAIADFDLTQRLGEIKIPTLVIHGSEDAIISPQAAEELARLIPLAQLAMISGAGHLLLAEARQILEDLISSFLSKFQKS
jgi:3-oxoadipate enol-lactonase